MIERIKSLGEMETKQKCVVQRFEIIIPLHQKITTQYIASASFTCGFFSYRRLDKGFFATFFVRHHAHWKKVGGFAAHRLKMRAKSRYHSEYLFEHITIYAFVRGYVRCPALKGLFAEGLAVETHII